MLSICLSVFPSMFSMQHTIWQCSTGSCGQCQLQTQEPRGQALRFTLIKDISFSIKGNACLLPHAIQSSPDFMQTFESITSWFLQLVLPINPVHMSFSSFITCALKLKLHVIALYVCILPPIHFLTAFFIFSPFFHNFHEPFLLPLVISSFLYPSSVMFPRQDNHYITNRL